MPFTSNGYYNNPAIGQMAGSLASMFAPPTPQEMLTTQTIAQQNAASAATADALSRQPASIRDLWNITHDPAKMAQFQQNVIAASGAPIAAQDPWAYAGTQDFGKTAASNLVKVIPKGSTLVAPSAIGAPYGFNTLAPPGADTSDDSTGPAKAAPVAAPGGPVGFAVPDDPSTKQMNTDQLRAKYAQDALDNPGDPTKQAALANFNKMYPPSNGGPTINVNGNPNGIEDGWNKAVGADLAEVEKAAKEAPTTRGMLLQLKAAAEHGGKNITTGPAAQFALKTKQALGSALGVNFDGVPEAELMNNIGTTIAAQATRAMSQRGGTQFEFANQLLTKPGLSQSPEGMKAIIAMKMQELDDNEHLGQLANDPQNRANWLQVRKNYYATHPVMSPFFPGHAFGEADIAKIDAATPEVGPAPTAPAAITPFNANGAPHGATGSWGDAPAAVPLAPGASTSVNGITIRRVN